MKNWAWSVIAFVWVSFFLVWLVTAFNVKPTKQRYRALTIRYFLIFLVFVVLLGLPGKFLEDYLWHCPLGFGVAADLIAAVGLAFTVWARLTLGRNWSGNVSLKEDHELITRGPYALVRHPIYTGILLMALGTTIDSGQVLALVIFVLLIVGLCNKFKQEERVMTEHFAEKYTNYKKRVKAIIPYVL
jgi:protein-S-isoprenylcysteine O-methyltransferase Ste14